MALVALTVAFATLGVYPRDSGGAAWFVAWLLSLGCPGSTWPADVDRAALALGLLLELVDPAGRSQHRLAARSSGVRGWHSPTLVASTGVLLCQFPRAPKGQVIGR
jgi:hypothetical protein